jgi:hypothetical protein
MKLWEVEELQGERRGDLGRRTKSCVKTVIGALTMWLAAERRAEFPRFPENPL